MPRITIASYDEAHALLGASPTNYRHVVSINDPDQHPPETLAGHSARSLVLHFHDVVESTELWPEAPTLHDVRAIVRFARAIKQGDATLVHCAAGISRSSAAALTILAAKQSPTREGAEVAHRELLCAKTAIRPNRAIIKHADSILGFDGHLLRVRDEIFPPCPEIEGLSFMLEGLDELFLEEAEEDT